MAEINVSRNHSDNINLSKLKSMGLNVKKEKIGQLLTIIFTEAITELKNEILTNFTIEDFIGENSQKILKTYMKYFQLGLENNESVTIYTSDNFFSLEDKRKNSFFSTLKEEYIVIKKEMLEKIYPNLFEDTLNLDLKKMPKVYRYFILKMLLEKEELLSVLKNKDTDLRFFFNIIYAHKKYYGFTKSGGLKENIQNRDLQSILDTHKFRYISREIRIEAYRDCLEHIDSITPMPGNSLSGRGYYRTNFDLAKRELLDMLPKIIEAFEIKYFAGTKHSISTIMERI